ncbi:S-layer homology domain-containing protein [Paenibacillus roseipurpureus]|uniref:S-layer homology domain-containing protein n=1 Tax=Paenibacillus roseopurpureus TaxID=2918901 RepID=A0AA96RNZ7_9BACL|nr:S-layer homology domain-containing protein [Paenibacillus sp. MBLB1832]WNR46102.1 S-layer homology domain-containing protein [Paenibacillus sp. MBLB1832]
MRKTVATWMMLAAIVIGIVAAGGNAGAEQAATFAIETDQAVITTNDLVTVTVKGENISPYFAFDMELVYDKEKLELVQTETNINEFAIQADKKEESRIRLGITKSTTQATGNGVVPIVRAVFRGKASGAANVTLVHVKALDNIKLEETKFVVGATGTVNISLPAGAGTSDPPPLPPPPPPPPPPPSPPAESGATIELSPVLQATTAKAQLNATSFNKALQGAALDNDGAKVVSVILKEIEGAATYALELPKDVIQESAPSHSGEEKKINIMTPIGDIMIPPNMFKSKDVEGVSTITISIASANTSKFKEELKTKIGKKPVIELNVFMDGKVINWKNNQAPVTVHMAYTPTAEELKDPEHIAVWYVDGAGNVQKVPSGVYNPATGTVVFSTTHFSEYAIGYEITTFGDIRDLDWAKKPIEILTSKGIVNGTSQTTFTPNASITRADFIQLLIGTLGLTADVNANFEDVSKEDYFYESAGIAKTLGISQGVGGNTLHPTELITRQDMMVLVERAMRIGKKEMSTANITDLHSFQDWAQVSSYANDSLSILLRKGLIEGDGNRLNPTGYTTRAEAAVLLYRVYKNK